MNINQCDVVVLCLSHFAGGMELDAIKMTKGLTHAGISTLLVCKHGSFISQQASLAGINYQEVRFKTKFSIGLISKLREIIIKQKIKNIIFLGTSEIKSIYFSLIGLTKVKLIVRYGTTRSSSKKDLLHRWLYSRVNYHLCISEHLLKNVEKIIPISDKANSGVIYTSTNFMSTPPQKPTKKAIHIGRIAHGKGQIDALQAIENTDIPLKLVGTGDDKNYLLKLNNEIKNRNLEGQAELIGYHPQPQELFHDASIFLFPSHGEGLSNALIEALGNGLICIVYDNTVFPEFKKLGFHIHLARDRDIEHLRELFNIILINFNQEIELASSNILLARAIFSQKNEIKNLSDILI
ncbi:hypothetical protein GCM10011502_13790 [Oceanisphaera marina]|uniref:Glycosyl transferase family 1 domain-containing protein n=1 Tax=Oceanisphaera marina TaxID=2017550 RepID=A0ABQ1IIU9_9GAMM|nr:glycosyltransferase [Oceanisphaera marina]GGB41732.1 hypothetical protein GCM10011502_13790 [Oceanisphaera marina]